MLKALKIQNKTRLILRFLIWFKPSI